MRRIIEGVKRKNLPEIMTFIDFSKAFDSIEHDSMFAILKAYGIPPIILGAIKAPITLFAPKLYDQTVIQITSRSVQLVECRKTPLHHCYLL